MARRIGLAQALINDPELILLDEPTTGLDPIGTREMKDLILSLKQQGKTVLLCSHLLADVQDVCDRITILFGGKMQTLGRCSDLLQVQDITQIQARGMIETQIEEMRQFLARMGVSDAAITHPTTTLEDLFMRIVRERTGNGQAQAAGRLAHQADDRGSRRFVQCGRSRDGCPASRINASSRMRDCSTGSAEHFGWRGGGLIVVAGRPGLRRSPICSACIARVWAISGVCFRRGHPPSACSGSRRWRSLGVIVVSQLSHPIDAQDAIRQATNFACSPAGCW